MKKPLLIILIACFGSFQLIAQETQELNGEVTFVTANNVYVRFDSTEAIPIGETLNLNGSPCLKVTEKSSTSVVCTIINSCTVTKGDTISYTAEITETPEEPDDNVISPPPVRVRDTVEEPEATTLYQESIRGRISVASYNTFSNLRENRNRFQTKFSLNANHLGGGKFSIESFLAYRNNLSPPENFNGRTSIFNVYNLNATYDATPTLAISLGRKINPNASTIGANDGLQAEKSFGNFFVGGLVGFRPDFYDYSLNTDLLQYGAYTGISSSTKAYYGTSTIGFVEQTNNGTTDRRYLFLQHSSTIASDLNLFSSAEYDIFGLQGASTRLTNLYLSARYRFSRAANVMVSYDSRKQIIYYETFESEVERLLDEDLARQGLRIRLNVRPAKILWAGLSYSSRFQTGEQNKSDNIYGYMTLTKIPKIGGRLNVSYNNNTSRYLTSNIFGVRHSRDIVKNKLIAEFYFRMSKFEFENQSTTYSQNYYGSGLSWRIDRSWQFNINGEFSAFEDEKNFRFYGQLTKRFYSKKKK